jgi:hypothetical protein
MFVMQQLAWSSPEYSGFRAGETERILPGVWNISGGVLAEI